MVSHPTVVGMCQDARFCITLCGGNRIAIYHRYELPSLGLDLDWRQFDSACLGVRALGIGAIKD